MPLVIGVDSSTQSTKVEIRDVDSGRLMAGGSAPHPAANPPRSEQDPAAWWKALVDAIRMAGRDVSLSGVRAISVAAQQHGMVALGRAGQVIRPAKLWNDTESAPDIAALVEKLGARQWALACGSVPTASFTIAKLAWLRRAEVTAFAQTARVLLPHDWLTLRLCGEFITDRGDASGTAYWSPGEAKYRFDLLGEVDAGRNWDTMLPAVLGPLDAAGKISAAAANELGLIANVIVGPGTGDNMAGALGIALDETSVAISLGTSGTVYAVAEQATADSTGAVAGFADAAGEFLPLACTLNATKVTDAFAGVLNLDRDAFARTALDAPAGAGGIAVVPYLDGERTPNRPNATGTIIGIRSTVSAPEIARAAFEGVVCGLLQALDALAAANVHVEDRKIILLGGGARSPAYRKIMADLSGREVLISEVDQNVAAGACVQAAAVLSGVSPRKIAKEWGLGRGMTIAPDPKVDRDSIRANYAAAAAKI
ncbi:MAG: xylulokinase [Candidatus Binataceae bacterium]